MYEKANYKNETLTILFYERRLEKLFGWKLALFVLI